MTPDDFRELALNLKGPTEGQHMHHPDFRAHGRIFATLAYPNAEFGMVKLSPADQQRFVEMHPQAFTPVKGAWGLQGSTSVRLAAATRDVVSEALDLAWQLSSAERAAKARKKSANPARAAAGLSTKRRPQPKS